MVLLEKEKNCSEEKTAATTTHYLFKWDREREEKRSIAEKTRKLNWWERSAQQKKLNDAAAVVTRNSQ